MGEGKWERKRKMKIDEDEWKKKPSRFVIE